MSNKELNIQHHLKQFEGFCIKDFATAVSHSISLTLEGIYELAGLAFYEDVYKKDIMSVATQLYENKYIDEWTYDTAKQLFKVMKSVRRKFCRAADTIENRTNLCNIILLEESFKNNLNEIIDEFREAIFK